MAVRLDSQNDTPQPRAQEPTPFPSLLRAFQSGETTAADILRTQAVYLMGARSTHAALKAELAALQAAWKLANGELIARVDEAAAAVKANEETLRKLALAIYEHTDSKQLGYGITVKEMTRLRYDRGVALNWAKEKRMFLELDTRAFEAFAKAAPAEVPFVEISREPEATIAVDLSRALEVQP